MVLSLLPSVRILPDARLSGERLACESDEESSLDSPIPSTLTLGLNSTKERVKCARNPHRSFTLAAKRKILRSAGALDRLDSTPHHKLFLTGTLPGGTDAAMAAMSISAPKIVHLFRKWIAYKFPSVEHYFYCWELQKRGALHLHYCLYCPDADIRASIVEGFRSWWHSALCKFSDELGVDMFERREGGTWRNEPNSIQVDAQEVRSSVASYIAKYCSKSAGEVFSGYCPPRWSSVSRPLGALLEEYTEEVTKDFDSYIEASSSFVSTSEELSSPEAVCYSYSHKVGAGRTRIAYYGRNLEDSQSCQFQNASLTMNSRKRSALSHLSTKVVTALYQFMEALPLPLLDSSPPKSLDSNRSLTLLTDTLPRILRVLNGVNPTTQQVSNAKSVMTGYWRLLSSLSTSTPISCSQRLTLNWLSPRLSLEEKSGSLLRKYPNLSQLLKICRNSLSMDRVLGYRSTTSRANELVVHQKDAPIQEGDRVPIGSPSCPSHVEWHQLSFSG